MEALIALGADPNARDVTACTPLQNAAHGTYSALAAVPPAAAGPPAGKATRGHTLHHGHGGGAAVNGSAATANGGGAAAAGPMTVAQAAAAAAVPAGSEPDGLIPVRTGLAWATLTGGGGGRLGAWGLDGLDLDAGGLGLGSGAGEWRDAAALQLLKRAARRRGGGGGDAGSGWPAAADVSLQLAAYACGRGGELGLELGLGSGLADERGGGPAPNPPPDGGLELFLRRSSEAWQMSSLEADRKRLVAVAERLVQLGADPVAVDAEGRTALHLAAGCAGCSSTLCLLAAASRG